METITDQTRDLLAAIVEALDVPYDDSDGHVRELRAVRQRVAYVLGSLDGVLTDDLPAEPGLAARVLRRHIAEHPVSFEVAS